MRLPSPLVVNIPMAGVAQSRRRVEAQINERLPLLAWNIPRFTLKTRLGRRNYAAIKQNGLGARSLMSVKRAAGGRCWRELADVLGVVLNDYITGYLVASRVHSPPLQIVKRKTSRNIVVSLHWARQCIIVIAMSTIISFGRRRESRWSCRSWIFEQLTKDIIRAFPGDTEMAAALRSGALHQGLILDHMEKELAIRIAKSIQRVASEIVERKTEHQFDAHHRQVYVAVLAGLLLVIERELPLLEAREHTDPPPPMRPAKSSEPVVTPAMVYHIVTAEPMADSDGHSAVLIPNGHGCTYLSYADNHRVQRLDYNNIDDALNAARSAGYIGEQHWPIAPECCASAHQAAMAFDGLPWHFKTHNSWHMVCAALRAAGADVTGDFSFPAMAFTMNNRRSAGHSELNR